MISAEPKIKSEELRQAEERYRLLFDASPVPLCVIDNETLAFLAINDAALRLYGYTRNESRDKTLRDIFFAEDFPRFEKFIATRMQDPARVVNTLVRHRKKNGSPLWVEVRAHSLVFEGRQARIFQGYDVTRRQQAEEELRLTKAAIDKSKSAFFRIAADGTVQYVNEYACQSLGYTRHELIGKKPWDFDPDLSPEAWPATWSNLRQDKFLQIETRHRRKDGSTFPVLVTGNFIRMGKAEYSFTFVQDITERKAAEAQLRQAEEHYRLLFDASPTPLSVWDIETGKFLAVNNAALEQYGYTREESQRMTVMDLISPQDVPEIIHLFDQAQQGESLLSHSVRRHRRKDGTLMWVQVDGHDIEFDGHRARIAQTHDITQLVNASEQLKQAEKRYRQLFDASPVAMGVFDTETFAFIAFNDAGLALYGYTREEAMKASALDLYFPEDHARFKAYLANEMQNPERISNAILRQRRKDGSEVWVEAKAYMIDYGGRPARIVQVNDITRRLQAENELRKTEAHYRLLFEANPVPLGIYDPETLLFMDVNDAAVDQYGYSREEFLRMSVAQIFMPEDLPQLKQYIQDEILDVPGSYSSTWKQRRKDGSLFWVQMTGHNLEYMGRPARIVLAHDITEVKRSELREHASSEAMELLAKGVPVTQVLETIARSVEMESPDALCSILMLDDSGEHLRNGASPSLPAFYNAAIEGLRIGPTVGSCGAAIATGKRIIVDDIQTHPNWEPYRELAARAELRACWSNPIISASGKPLGSFAVYHREPNTPTAADIELIEHATYLAGIAIEQSLAREALQLASLVYQNSSEAMVVADAENHILAINPAFTRVTGYTLEEVQGKDPSLLSSEQQDESFYQSMWHAIDTNGQWQGEIWNRRKDGVEYAEWLTINSIYGDDGKVQRRVALFSDITDRKHAEALIWNQANYDALTQLPNRRLFRDRLDQELKKAHRDQQHLGLLFIDLDRFKEVNDTLGHHMGDELLILAAQRIRNCVRDSDGVARLGGDEFTVILPSLSDVSDIGRVAQNIIDALCSPFSLGQDQAYISASIGITVYPDDATAVDDLLKTADQAMYDAKRTGRNRYSYFTRSMQEAANQRMRLVRDIHQASATNEFMVFFQPIVELATGEIHKAEALLRWKHPEQGFISPAVFIPIAEDTGLIHDIGNWVFEETLRHIKHWRDRYDPNFQISINKSPVQFRAEGRVHENWIERLHQEGLPGDSFAIEITEGLLLNADTSINAKLLMFRDQGIQVAIDDFGTGYSSLSYLKKFDIDYLKIDQSFVHNLGIDKSDLALSEAIVVMAHKLGLKVVAEGVETERQRDVLQAIGCDYAQGYLYARPLPADQFEELLKQQQAIP